MRLLALTTGLRLLKIGAPRENGAFFDQEPRYDWLNRPVKMGLFDPFR